MKQHCLNPFRWLDITTVMGPWRAGINEWIHFSLCIRSWGGPRCEILRLPLQKAANVDPWRIWHARPARNARQAAKEHGVAKWCKGCPRLAGGLPPTVYADTVDWTIVSDAPTTLNLAYDRSCNLRCPSCRSLVICCRPATEMHALLVQFQDAVIRPLLHGADRAYLAGLGDPFGSPTYRELLLTTSLQDAPKLRWHIQTNGLGFTEAMYNRIPTRDQIDSVQFSIDAAKPETYLENRGDNFATVMRNLALVAGLRRSGRIGNLEISMVIQSNNWGQVGDFAKLGFDNACDSVQYSMLLDQCSYPPGEYLKRAVHLPGHEGHEGMLEALHSLKDEYGDKVVIELPRC